MSSLQAKEESNESDSKEMVQPKRMRVKRPQLAKPRPTEEVKTLFDIEEPEESKEDTVCGFAHDMMIHIIADQKQKEEERDIWKDSPYKDLVKFQSNNVGNVGEKFINTICESQKIPSSCDGSKTKKVGGGDGDGHIMGRSIEIKTALQGTNANSFQHELGEVPWKAGYMIFVDIAPECIYLTIFKNFGEETYKNSVKLHPYFPTKSTTWRKGMGAFKLDTSVNINEKSIKKGHAIKIIATTHSADIASFIRRVIE